MGPRHGAGSVVSPTNGHEGMISIPAERLREHVAALFRAVGVPEEDALVGADVLVTADLRGVTSHGVSNMLRHYLDWFDASEIRPEPEWRITRESASTANVDADRGLGIFLAPKLMRVAMEKASTTGIGFVTLHGGRHLGMCAYHSMLAPGESMIGICMSATGPLMVPTHGSEPMLGSNPISVAAPTGGSHPFVFDAAMTVSSGNRIVSARRAEDLVPGGVIADEAGRPVMDPSPAPESIRLLPLGGAPETGSHKGYGLAMVVEVLAGILSGAGFGATHGFDVANHVLAAIDIEAFVPVEDFLSQMDDYLETLRSTPPAPGAERVVTPGELSGATFDTRNANGIPLSAETVDWLDETGRRLGAGSLTDPSRD